MGQVAYHSPPPDWMDAPFHVLHRDEPGPLVLVCEHASHAMPPHLVGHIASDDVLLSHAGWDPGAEKLARHLSRELACPLVLAKYSRLAYDLNRPPTSPDAIRGQSEVHEIHGNMNLSDADRNWRVDNLYTPFHNEIETLLDQRLGDGLRCILVTVHTFAPVYFGEARDVEYGILHDKDHRLADIMLAVAKNISNRLVKRNEPYGPEDGVTHTLARHALPRGLFNVMIEVRNDLVETDEQIAGIASELTTILREAINQLDDDDAQATTGVPS